MTVQSKLHSGYLHLVSSHLTPLEHLQKDWAFQAVQALREQLKNPGSRMAAGDSMDRKLIDVTAHKGLVTDEAFMKGLKDEVNSALADNRHTREYRVTSLSVVTEENDAGAHDADPNHHSFIRGQLEKIPSAP